jgi:hypothetical protein
MYVERDIKFIKDNFYILPNVLDISLAGRIILIYKRGLSPTRLDQLKVLQKYFTFSLFSKLFE